jgi:Leucine-rich repeat (LRR) protein
MVSLKELNVGHNNLSTDDQLSDKLSGLTRLEKLEMSYCHLVELPSGYVQFVCWIMLLK